MIRPIPPLFDEALLERGDEACLDFFKTKQVGHQHLINSFDLARDNIEFGSDHDIVAIVGPTEVGTTVLARKLYKYYRDQWPLTQQLEAPKAMVCGLGISAPNSSGRVDENYWKRLLQDVLAQGGDTLYDKKLYVPATQFQLQPCLPYVHLGKQDIDVLKSSVARMLGLRHTKVLIINQAERLFPENDKAGCIRSQQVLLDLAAQCDTRIVLVANYQLLKTTCVGGDWLQRRNLVHLRRYNWEFEEDLINFNSTLDQFLGSIPSKLRLKRLTEKGATTFYVNSLGCIGTLKKTLMMATSHSFRTGDEMTEEFIFRFGQPYVTAARLAEQAKWGEGLLQDVDQKAVERILNPDWTPSSARGSVTPQRPARPATSGGAQGQSFGRRIGERTPTRDPVGGINARRA